ncbi:MAG: branched chain amino acid aminotransferase [Acidobacteria bacterium]|nr:MAG: branched chain amino acid aminotransferase [Acidobacteriota bacterium]PYR76630.1 MAG: branched chain amino acid aminotransferase [Acidobacteriota bacterium]
MAFPGTGRIWMNGSLVDWKDAKIHVGSHIVHYGSGVFEGARCYDTVNGPACFRLDAHVRRLLDSARIYRMEPKYGAPALTDAIHETINANGFRACYIRPIVYRGYDSLGVNPLPCPVDTAIMVWEWGAYFTKEAIEEGLDVKISTWARNAPNTTPAMAKSVANYANAQLIKMEAIAEGYAEGIALDIYGNLSEGSGQNIFIVRDGIIYTPPVGNSVLWGITRDSVMTIAREMGFEVREQTLPRETLYIADEVFFVGTAVEVTPIRSVDRVKVGRGRRGPVTEAIQQRFFQIVKGEAPDTHGWLQAVNAPAAATSGTAKGR